ncbi:MAG: HAMP domain-containing sensor histidine kinase [bacterium]|nr:HAMP domain-containing sensor histidine kinase [bacterium]
MIKKITLFYTVVFSATLFLLSMGVLYSVNVYQNIVAKNDIEAIKESILSKTFVEADLKERIQIAEDQNIRIMVEKNGLTVFQSQGFEKEYRQAATYDEIWSFDDDEQYYLSEKTQFEVEGTPYKLYLVKDLYSERRFLAILLLILVVIDVIGMIISVILGYWFAKRMLRPIDAISNTAKSMNSNNLSVRIPLPSSKDELYMLSKTFNDMADGLELSFQKQAQFVADASHELKTPIAAITGHVNLLNRWGKKDEKALDTSLDAIQKEASYMATLIQKLLFLAKLDNGKAVEAETFNLSELLNDMVEEMRIYKENHRIEVVCDEAVILYSDKAMVVQLIRILLDNAFKFTPEGGLVTILCQKQQEGIHVQITDTGPGMSEETKAKIFDRFYTENQSRNKDLSGNGLGLSIAKELCRLLQIQIDVESQEGTGTTFHLIFR